MPVASCQYLRSQTGLPRVEIINRMIATFTGLYGLSPSEITPGETAKAEQLVAEKFGTEDRLQRVP